ncbi:Transcription factor bye1 [Lachnellula suecica]|uniref:Transcription factor BYE1 n=1 Tax=Lachnellula suecica TaxID=602035 RepID=A0A8T9BX52_9HELO|nr:Transcription factor bye1 [Lachnellula suecica]
MADEPRRSVRATKGQHTKTSELLDQPSPVATTAPKKKLTKKASKKAAKKDEEEDPEVIRCVCGARETGDEDNEPWIACDKCESWQHNICVGISRYGDDAPDNYLCEKCDPTFPLHKELLDGMKKGRKVWEERRRKAEQEIAEEEAEKVAQKKKGKKSQGKRASDLSEISHGTNGKAKSPSVPVSTEKKPVARTSSTKRKARDESHDTESKEPQQKIRKVSEQQKSPESDLPKKILDLETSRQAIATALSKSLNQPLQDAVKNGLYRLNGDDTLDAKAERMAIEIENAAFITLLKPEYNKQTRALIFNLKKNHDLCNRLLKRTLSAGALAIMSTDDMASKQLKAETAKMKAQADKQSIMVTDDNEGPRVRRTHKGDEIVEDDSFAVPDESMNISRRRSMLDPNGDMAVRSRENSPMNEVELPANINDHRSHDDIRGHTIPKQPLMVETKQPHPVRKSSTQADFDINKIYSSVQSPVNTQHIRRPSGNTAPPVNGPGVDPEIDKLLQDDDGNESPPYSPAEYNSDPDTVWRGTVTMDSVTKFAAAAKHIGGADLSSKMPWEEILQKDLRVAGRIDQEKANEYLCSLRYSAPTDVVIVAVTPTGEAATKGFHDLFQYFNSKNRYGVLTNKGVGNIRDTYLVPVPASPGSLPDFVINLEGHRVPEERTEPMILVTLVIRSESQAEHARNSEGGAETYSPSIMGHPQRQMSMSGTAPAMSPIAPQGGSFASPSVAHPQQFSNDEAQRRHQAEEQRTNAQREGEANARRILGPHVNDPTVAFLMPQAYQMRILEWEIITDILDKDEKARHDLQHLSAVLETRMAAESQKSA